MSDNYSLLLNKLNLFLSRFYFNKALRGLLMLFIVFSFAYIAFVLLEFFGYYNRSTRAALFFSFIFINGFVLLFYVVNPIIRIYFGNKDLQIKEAALIIGKHFKKEVGDKIINTLQLVRNFDQSRDEAALIIASIDQRAEKLVPVPFKEAIDIQQVTRLIPGAFSFITLLIIGVVLFPGIFREPANRLVLYNVHFERPAPFSLIFVNGYPIEVVSNETYGLQINTEGNVIPNELHIVINGVSIPFNRGNSRNEFFYEFRSLNRNTEFFIKSGEFLFGPYVVNVKTKSIIKNFSIIANYPRYTRLGEEIFSNTGDLRVPYGTVLNFTVFTEETESVYINKNEENFIFSVDKINVFSYSFEVNESLTYTIRSFDNKKALGDSLTFDITSIVDMFPAISVEEYQDPSMLSHIFFRGNISDDYGFTDLTFNYRIVANDNKIQQHEVSFIDNRIDFVVDNLIQTFFYHVDLIELGIGPGKTMEYFFRVRDNDLFNNFKSTQTAIFTFSVPDIQDLLRESIVSDDSVVTGLNKAREEVDKIQDEIDQIRRAMMETENVSWEQREMLMNLLNEQERVQNSYNELKEMREKELARQSEFKEENSNIAKKQEELQKLFEEVFTDELKALYEKIQQELQNLNREAVFEMLDRLQFELQDFETRLERAIELFKRLQVERLLSETIDVLNSIREDLDDIINESENTDINEDSFNKQERLNSEFNGLSDLIEDIMKKNEALRSPNSFDDTSELRNEIKKKLDESLQKMNRQDNQGSNRSRNDASQGMGELSEQLENMLSSIQQQNLAEDIRTLRTILDNLLKASFGQEGLMEEFRVISIRDPRYFNLIQKQNKISTDLVQIKDSLNALAKRQIQIQSVVNREIAEINMNIEQAVDHLINRRKHNAVSRQQFVMTHINNLALLLNESMQNMQSQMQAQGECGVPTATGEGMQDLRQMQEQMNQMLEQLRQGHQPNPGEVGEGSSGMSEQLARLAAEQEAIRRRLSEVMGDLRSEGMNIGELNEIMEDMERTELDIVTNRISAQTQLRQQRIVTRLLEHERALMEREQEERRVGETAKFFDYSNPVDFFQYNRQKSRSLDMLRSMPPGFRPHYKNLVESYFLNVQE